MSAPYNPAAAVLRPYQEHAIEMLRDAFRSGIKRVGLQLPTGAGKTQVAAEMIRGALSRGKKSLFIVDRIELIGQTSRRFDAEGIPHGVIQGAHERIQPWQPVQVCSIQTLSRRRFPPADFIVWDEFHTVYSAGAKIMEKWDNIPMVGLSATPWSKGLGKHWQQLVVGATTTELIEAGYLVPFTVYGPPGPDLTGVHTVAGEYHQGELAAAADKPKLVADIVLTWLKRGEDRQTICFATNIAHSKHIVDVFKSYGVKAEHIDAYSDSDERREILARFAEGKTRVVSSVDILSKGYDQPTASCLIAARPTKSLILHVQQVGRSIRTHDNIAEHYRRYKEMCGGFQRSDEMAPRRQAGEHGGGCSGLDGRSCEKAGVQALEQSEQQLQHKERAHVPAVPQQGEGEIHTRELFDCCHTRGVSLSTQVGSDRMGSEPGEQAASESQGRKQAEQSRQQSGMGYESGKQAARSTSWLVPGVILAGGRSLVEQADGRTSKGNKGGIEELSSWTIDGTGKKIRRSQNNDKRDQGWEELGACFVAEDFEEARYLAMSLSVLHKGKEALLVVPPDTDTGNAMRIVGARRLKKNAVILDHSGNTSRLGFVTDPLPATLDDGTHKASKQSAQEEPLPKACPKCHFMKQPKERVCPACGFEAERKDEVEVEDGELVKFAKADGATKAQWIAMLMYHAKEKGWKEGAASWAYRDKFGVWPASKQVLPIPPSEEVLKWLQHRTIKRAKSHDKPQPKSCRYCGSTNIKRLPGKGPHEAGLGCVACGRHLAWLPKGSADTHQEQAA